ncbi:MAG: hypothetical protein KatS3mg045_0911 [Bellilinea sp.]|nr:MAG: hypothetical protein KatS3mg045_0911 [Bellilinea sp.]
MIQRLKYSLYPFLWAGLILLLPITSLPLLSKAAGGSMVAPASVLPLGLLLLIFVPLNFPRLRQIPAAVLPLLAFLLLALLSSALSFFIEFPLFREANRMRNMLSGLLTLGVGISFFFAALLLTDSEERLSFFFKWVNIGGGIALLWAGLQSAYWYMAGDYPDWMVTIQGLFSSSGNLYIRRTTGFAFEPSWLGHQLAMFYLPYWLAASFRRSSVFHWRFWKFSAENLLLAGGVMILVLSLARNALLSFSLAVGWLLLLATGHLAGWIHRKFISRQSHPLSRRVSVFVQIFIWLVILGIYAGILTGGAFLLTRLDPRMADLFRVISNPYTPLEAANYLFFGERVAFWITGLQIFSEYPLFGVGLENAGYFFPEKLPLFGWTVVESHKMYYSSALPNTLSLWIRLLSETGIIGFSLFFSFLYLIWNTTRPLIRDQNQMIATLALTAQLTLLALGMEGMSVDTFAFPYFWLIFGWLLAAWRFRTNFNNGHFPTEG